jgi:GAF domain-containing protein
MALTTEVEMRSVEAQRVLDSLDEELVAAGEVLGAQLVWSAADVEVLGMIAAHIDRRADLARRYKATAAKDARLKIALSTELRLTEQSLSRLLKTIEMGIPTGEDSKPLSATTIKAQHAARSRWKKVRLSEQKGGA